MMEDFKKILFKCIPYLPVFYIGNKVAWLYRIIPFFTANKKIYYIFMHSGQLFQGPLISMKMNDIFYGILFTLLIRGTVYLKSLDKKKYRTGSEYGSARWGTKKDIQPFVDKEFSKNIILTKTEFLTLNNRPLKPKYARNNNVAVIGGSGSGKTAFWLTPNLLQMHSSYVVTDPKGTIVVNCGNALLKFGYRVIIFNTIDFKKSMRYNPLSYIHSEKDILKLVTT